MTDAEVRDVTEGDLGRGAESPECAGPAARVADGAMRTALIVALVTMAVAAFGVAARSTYGAQTSSDEPQYLLTALSLAEDRDLDISDEIERRAFEPFHEISLNTQTFPLNEDGQRLSPHDPLLPLVAAPAMWLGGWVGVRVLLVLVGGLVAGLTTWTAVRRLGLRPSGAGLGVGAVMVGAPIAAYSTQVYPEIMAAACVAAAAAAGLVERLERRHLVVIVVAVVALPWLAVKYAPVAAAVTAAVGWRLFRERRWSTLGWSTAVLAVAGALYLLLHQRIYGGWTVYATGDHFVDDGEFAVVGTDPDYLGRSRRLVGLLVDRHFGLVPWAPVWLLAPVAVAVAAVRPLRSRLPGASVDHRALVLAPIAAGWFVATFVALTMHGWWSPGRQVVVIVPLVALTIARMVDGRRPLLWFCGVTGLVGASNWVWLGIEASTDRRTVIVDFFDTAAPGYRLLAPWFARGVPTTDTGDAVLAAWALVVVAAMGLAVWRARRVSW